MNKRIVLAAAASAVALSAVVGVSLGVGHDEPRLVRTAGVSAPLEESSTTSTSMAPAAETSKVAELDATVDNHETRIRVLESTTTTAPAATAAPVASSPVAPAVEAQPTTTTMIVSTTTTTVLAPTTTTTRWLSAGMCPAEHHTGLNPDGVYCAAPAS